MVAESQSTDPSSHTPHHARHPRHCSTGLDSTPLRRPAMPSHGPLRLGALALLATGVLLAPTDAFNLFGTPKAPSVASGSVAKVSEGRGEATF